ncbi:MAG: TetR family transcriptional regulator [Burkholderiaceae bacterium]|nr:TetR family transcriptional regulator [Burkholderiaceae bacterium]
MKRATRKKTRETRDKLLDAAECVFYEKGVSGTTLNDVAEAAGVTRGAVYWHFRNKSDLFGAMVDRVRKPIHDMIEEMADGNTEDPLGRLREKTLFLMREIHENEHYRKVMSVIFHKCEYTDAASEFLAYDREWQASAHDMIVRVLVNARQKRQLPDDIDINLAVLVLRVVFNGLLNNWLLRPEEFDLLEDSGRLYEGVFSMLRESPDMRVKSSSAHTEKTQTG